MCTAIIDSPVQRYEKGHASNIVRLLPIHAINNDILYSRFADGQPRLHQETFMQEHVWNRQNFTYKQEWPKKKAYLREISPRPALGLCV